MSTGLPAPRRVDIRAMRERFGLTQIALADALNVDETTVRRWERGKVSPSPMALAHIRSLQRRLSAEREGQGQRQGAGAIADSEASASSGGGLQSSAARGNGLPGQGQAAEAGMPRRRLPSL